MSKFTIRLVAAVSMAASLALPLAAHADLPGRHPAYLHALTDLRTARWLMAHQPGDRHVYANEDVAITEVDAAIGEIRHASFEDGKDLRDHPMADVPEHGSRLLRAIETLKQARNDIAGEEDNPEVHGLRDRAYAHIDRALWAAEQAHADWLRDAGR